MFALLLIGCGAHQPVKNDGEHREPVSYDGKRSIGIDLVALGNEPFWMVDMDSEDSTTIFISDYPAVRYKSPALVLDSISKIIKYTFKPDVTLTLLKEKCINSMSSEVNTFTASLNYFNKTYKGCGKYIIATRNPLLSSSTLRLNDIWALKKFRGNPVIPSDFKEGVPVLELHLNDGRFLGNTNCNTISGSLDVGDSYITFSEFTSTKKLCDGDFEYQYLNDLKSVDSWTLDNMLLILKNKGQEIMVFHKID